MQRLMAQCLVSLVKHGVGITVTTHSDYFVSEIGNAVRRHGLRVGHGRRTGAGLGEVDVDNVRATRFERHGNYCITRPIVIDTVDGIDQSTFTEVMESQYEDSASLVSELLEERNRGVRLADAAHGV